MKDNVDQKAYAEWYSNTQARINTIAGQYSEDWNAIKQAREEWLATVEILELWYPTFPIWLLDKYGIRIIHVDSGLSTEIEIIDEAKYIIFLLKYK